MRSGRIFTIFDSSVYASKLTKVVDRLQATLPDEEVGSFCRLVRHELKAIKTALGTT